MTQPPGAVRAQLITGDRVPLEAALAEAVHVRQASDPLAAVHVLVGSTLLRPCLRRVLATQLGGAVNVHFVTPGELGLVLGEPTLLRDGRQPLPLLADRVLASRAAVAIPGAFAAVAELPGFPGALGRTLRDLRFAGVAPQALQAVAASEQDQDDPDTQRLASLAALHAHATDGRAGRYGADDALAIADPGELETGLILYGVWETTALLRGVLQRVVDAGQQLTVLLPATTPTTASAAERLTRFLVDDLAAEVVSLTGDAGATDLARAQRTLFTTPDATPPPPDGTLALATAPDPVREVRHVVRQLLAWSDDGLAFHDMAIAYRDGSTYRPLIEAALREAEIPAYVHEGTPLTERPLGRRILALLELAETRDDEGAPQMSRATVLRFLADARLPDETYDDYGRPSVPRWETITRRAGVTGGLAEWRTRLGEYEHDLLSRVPEGEDPAAWVVDRIADAKQLLRFVEELHAILVSRPPHGPWERHVAWLDDLLARYVADATPVRGALADLARLDQLTDATDAAGFDRAVTSVLEGLRDRDVLGGRAGAFGLRGISVVDVVSLRQLGFKAVAVVGLNERSFPPPPREDPLLLDDRRAQLHDEHDLALPLRARGGDPEPLQFACAVAAASERLLATCARAGSDGRTQLPSTFFRALAEQLAGARVTAAGIDTTPIPGLERLPAWRLSPADPAVSLTAGERRRALLEAGAPGAIELVRHRLPRTALGALARDARSLRTLTPFDGVVSPDVLDTLYALPLFEHLSATSLENYAVCPHRHLLANVLGLREIEEPEELHRLSALDKGRAVHTILETFMRERPPGKLDLGTERRRLQSVAAPVLDQLEADGRTGYALLWAVDRTRIEEDLDQWLLASAEHDASTPAWPYRGFEVRFGPRRHGSEPQTPEPLSRDTPLTIPLPGGQTLRLSGFVDRVDYAPSTGRFEVIDYKTGSMWGKEVDALQGGKTLQLPLYVLAIAAALDVDPSGGSARYESVDRKGRFDHVTFDGDLVSGETPPLVELLDELVEARRAGDFHREPGESDERGNCRFCPVKGACEPRRRALYRRKSSSPEIDKFAVRGVTFT